VGGITWYYFSAVAGQKLYFLELFLNQKTIDEILKKNWILFIIFIITNFMIVVLEDLYDTRKTSRTSFIPIYNEICRDVYIKYIENNKEIKTNLIRVSIHKGIYNSFHQIRLINVGRYQNTSPWKLSNVRFHNGEGCVGSCFNTNSLISMTLSSEVKNNLFKYWKLRKKNYKLRLKTSFLLSIKSLSIISFPILDKENGPWGALSIDSLQPDLQKYIDTEELDKGKKEYRFVFNDREVI
jgi:hypothetical protein